MNYLSYAFVRRALLVACVFAPVAALYGVPMTLRGKTRMADGLAQIAFTAMVAASLTGIGASVLVLPVTVVAALALTRLRSFSDAKIAAIGTTALAAGYFAMNITHSSANPATDVCTVLFGTSSILTLSDTDTALAVVISIVGVAYFYMHRRAILAHTVDPDAPAVRGMTVVTALVIALGVRLVGSLLTTGLMVLPVLGTMACGSFYKCARRSAILAFVAGAAGLFLSVVIGAGAGVVILLVLAVLSVVVGVIA